MKNKNTSIILALVVAMSIFSCSKKITSISDTEKYQKLSQQLEMNRESSNTLSASADEKAIEISTKDTRFETALAKANLTEVQKKRVEKIVTKIQSSKAYQKAVAKKSIESSITKQNSPEKANAITGNLRTGIILAAIGVILLIVGRILWFDPIIGSIFYVIGAILLLIGLIMILLSLI